MSSFFILQDIRRAYPSKSNWLEGTMLTGVYVIAAIAFFFSP